MFKTKAQQTLYTVAEAAKLCGVSRVTIWRWIKSNGLPAMKTAGGHHRIDGQELWTFLAKHNGSTRKATPSQRLRTLVVDDDPQIQKYLSRLLTDLGHSVQTSKDGFEAGLRVATFRPQLVILDIVMPNMDGLEVCRLLKSEPSTAAVHVIAISGYDVVMNERRALACGADSFIAKPIDRIQLLNEIETLLKPQFAP